MSVFILLTDVVLRWRDASLRLTNALFFFVFFPAASFGFHYEPTPHGTIKRVIVSERMDPGSEGVIRHLLSVRMTPYHWCDDESWLWRSRLRTLTQEVRGATSVGTTRAVEQMLLKLYLLLIIQMWLFECFKILPSKFRCSAFFFFFAWKWWSWCSTSFWPQSSEMQHERIGDVCRQTANPDHQFAQQM